MKALIIIIALALAWYFQSHVLFGMAIAYTFEKQLDKLQTALKIAFTGGNPNGKDN